MLIKTLKPLSYGFYH